MADNFQEGLRRLEVGIQKIFRFTKAEIQKVLRGRWPHWRPVAGVVLVCLLVRISALSSDYEALRTETEKLLILSDSYVPAWSSMQNPFSLEAYEHGNRLSNLTDTFPFKFKKVNGVGNPWDTLEEIQKQCLLKGQCRDWKLKDADYDLYMTIEAPTPKNGKRKETDGFYNMVLRSGRLIATFWTKGPPVPLHNPGHVLVTQNATRDRITEPFTVSYLSGKLIMSDKTDYFREPSVEVLLVGSSGERNKNQPLESIDYKLAEKSNKNALLPMNNDFVSGFTSSGRALTHAEDDYLFSKVDDFLQDVILTLPVPHYVSLEKDRVLTTPDVLWEENRVTITPDMAEKCGQLCIRHEREVFTPMLDPDTTFPLSPYTDEPMIIWRSPVPAGTQDPYGFSSKLKKWLEKHNRYVLWEESNPQ